MSTIQESENDDSINFVNDEGNNCKEEPASESDSNNEADEKDVLNDNAVVESDNTVTAENKEVPEKRKRLKREFDDSEENSETLPKELKEMFGPLVCELCQVKSNSTLSAYCHYKGRTHKRNIETYLVVHNLKPTPKKAKACFTPINCEHCNVLLTSEIHKLQHFSGRSHKKRVLNPSYKIKVPAAEKDPTGRFGIGKLFLKLNESTSSGSTSNEGKEVSEELETKEVKEKFYCELCNVTTTSAETLSQHKTGAKHLKKAHFNNEDYGFLAKYRTPSNNYYCDTCNVLSNNGDQFLMHIKSKKHKKLAG